MGFDRDAGVGFVATQGRVLEWRRLRFLLGWEPASGVLAALDGFGNADGGFGWGLEPDLRSVTSQPVAAMHALEVLADVGDVSSRRPVAVCDWLGSRALGDGGVPFALPFSDTDGSAGHWVGADPGVSSLQMTTQLAAHAHRLGRLRADVAGHPWLVAATSFCLDAIEAAEVAPHPYELMFSMRFLDAVPQSPRVSSLLARFAGFVRTDGPTPVPGGSDGEVLYPLDFTPVRESASRALFDAGAIGADVERLAGQQQADGGWPVSFTAGSPAAALEWRAYATVQALTVLSPGAEAVAADRLP